MEGKEIERFERKEDNLSLGGGGKNGAGGGERQLASSS